MVFDFLKGEFIDVISWLDDTRDTMVWRFERRGNAIKYGAKLTVREGQAAVFIHEGQLADVFGPGLYMLETNNMPIMTTLQHWDHGFQSPFKSEIYFVNTTRFNDLKWGTKNPIMTPRPRIRPGAPARLRHLFDARHRPRQVHDGNRRHRWRVHRRRDQLPDPQRDPAGGQPRAGRSRTSRCWTWRPTPSDLGKLITTAIAPQIAEYGLALPEFYIENICCPKRWKRCWTSAPRSGIAGDLNKYMQFNAAEAMGNPASAAGAAMGTGMGAAIGMGMASAGRALGAAPRPAAPPPPPPPPRPTALARGRERRDAPAPSPQADPGRHGDRGHADRAPAWSGPPARTAGSPPPTPPSPASSRNVPPPPPGA